MKRLLLLLLTVFFIPEICFSQPPEYKGKKSQLYYGVDNFFLDGFYKIEQDRMALDQEKIPYIRPTGTPVAVGQSVDISSPFSQNMTDEAVKGYIKIRIIRKHISFEQPEIIELLPQQYIEIERYAYHDFPNYTAVIPGELGTGVGRVYYQIIFKENETDSDDDNVDFYYYIGGGDDIAMITGKVDVPQKIKPGKEFTIKYPTNIKDEDFNIGLYNRSSSVYPEGCYFLAEYLTLTKTENKGEYRATVSPNIQPGLYRLFSLDREWEVINNSGEPSIYSPYKGAVYCNTEQNYRPYIDVENEGEIKIETIKMDEDSKISTFHLPLNTKREFVTSPIFKNIDGKTFTGEIGVFLADSDGLSTQIATTAYSNIEDQASFGSPITCCVPESVTEGTYSLRYRVSKDGLQWNEIFLTGGYPQFYTVHPTLKDEEVPQIDEIFSPRGYLNIPAKVRFTISNPSENTISGYIGMGRIESKQYVNFASNSPKGKDRRKSPLIFNDATYISIEPGESQFFEIELRQPDTYLRASIYPYFKKNEEDSFTRIGDRTYTLEKMVNHYFYPLFYTFYDNFLEKDIFTSVGNEVTQLEPFNIIAQLHDWSDLEGSIAPTIERASLYEKSGDNYNKVYELSGTLSKTHLGSREYMIQLSNITIPTEISAGTYTLILSDKETLPFDFENVNPMNTIFTTTSLYKRHIPNLVVKEAVSVAIEEAKHEIKINSIIQDYLNINGYEAVESLHLFDAAGNLVIRTTDVEARLDMSLLAEGVYILKLQTADQIYTHKVIKK